MDIRIYQSTDFEAVLTLWESCGLLSIYSNPESDIERQEYKGTELFLVAEIDQQIVGSVMGGYDGYLGWLQYLAVEPHFRGRGIANALINRLEKKLIARGCSQLSIIVRENNYALLSVCEKLGYETQDILLLNKQLLEEL